MATPRKTAAKTAAPRKSPLAPTFPVQEPEAKVLGKFAQLEKEAVGELELLEPYVIGEDDGIVPDIVITEPVETERIVAMAILMEHGIAALSPQDFQPMLRAICGDAYERVWNELLAGKHYRVAGAFLVDVQKHFYGQRTAAAVGASGLPGKSPA